ncbi:RmlC-like cupin [Microthyrium microscopicum]|uniref:RmlC-like cupin n=1 Tax=Microthyrium microscopicum TaxID=703497 RepID=A0A6A6U012_9PEZI|nr:RmlC-like cupin [Microthyrium microscopicum]
MTLSPPYDSREALLEGSITYLAAQLDIGFLNAPESDQLGVLPHLHKTHYENFYCSKGRVQVWAQKNETGEQARVLTQGDYGGVPQNTIHTFQMTDPDTQLTGVISPGGFEKLFFTIGDPSFKTSTGTPFVPGPAPPGMDPGANPGLIGALQQLDVYAQFQYNPRRDFVNGSAGSGVWHNGKNTLALNEKTPNFIAKNYGPKYLNTENGYKVIAPLATGKQTGNNFTMGTITMSPKLANLTENQITPSQHLAFQIEEGQLVVNVKGQVATLIFGDVVFVPSGTPFSYFASVPFTKFLYVSAGGNGLDAQLLQKSAPWNYTTYPTYAGYKV